MADDDLRIRVLERGLALRAAEAAGGVAAAHHRWTESPSGDRVARLRLSDGLQFGWVEVRVPVGQRMPKATSIEFAVEELAKGVDGDRLLALEARSPMTWGEIDPAG
jgi:hypothetical protein